MKKKQVITHQDIVKALRKFQQQGGIIGKLPDQKYQAPVVVGAERYANFESISSIVGG